MKTYTLEEIKELVNKTTEGPWGIQDNPHGNCYAFIECEGGTICRTSDGLLVGELNPNAQFIAASRTIVPQLVEWVEKLMNLLKESSDFDMTKEVHLEDWRYGEDTWTEDEMKLIIRWQKGRIQYGARQLEKAIKTFKDIRDFGLGKFKGTLDAKLAHSILMADLTLKELGVE